MSNFHVHSDYSARDSIQSVQAIIDYQRSIGKNFFALSDHGVMSCFNEAMELYEKVLKEDPDFKFIPGCEFYLRPEEENDGRINVRKLAELEAILKRKTEDFPGQKAAAKAEKEKITSNPLHNMSYYHITVLAFNQTGLENLYRINNEDSDFYYKHRVSMEKIKECNEGLVVLTGCPAGVMYRSIRNGNYEHAKKWLQDLKDVFGDRVYFELMYHNGIEDVPKDGISDEKWLEARAKAEKDIYDIGIKIAREVGVKICATNDSHYTYEQDRKYWEITKKAFLGDKYGIDPGNYSMLKDNYLFSKMYDVTEEELDEVEKEIVDRVERVKLPRSKYRSTHQDRADLERMVWTGFKNKRIGTPEEEKSLLQIPYELAVIQTKGFDKYFLVCKDIVKAAAEAGVLTGPGRGSSVGAEITYMADITKVDPIKYGLMFERFINIGRDSLPDVDMDLQSNACSNFSPTAEYYEAIDKMFAREQVADDEIKEYWKRYVELSEKVGDTRRKNVFDQTPNATYFNGPIWEQPEDIIVVKDR